MNMMNQKLPRRTALRWIAAAAPAAAVAPSVLAQAQLDTGFKEDDDRSRAKRSRGREKASADTECLLDNEKDLSRKELAKLREDLPGLEEALQTLRDYELPDDVEPAFTFRAMKSGRSR
jgi:hypothetical protein